MRRLFRIVLGFVLAMLSAAVVSVLFAMPPSLDLIENSGKFAAWATDAGLLALAAATHMAIFSLIFALVAIIIGEWLRQRHWSYYALAGIVIAIGGFLAQYAAENASSPTIINNYALVAFVSSGAVGGLFYWFFAGRNAGRRRPPAKLAVADDSADAEKPLAGSNPDTSDQRSRYRPAAADPKSASERQPEPKPMTSVPVTGPAKSEKRLRVERTQVGSPALARPIKA